MDTLPPQAMSSRNFKMREATLVAPVHLDEMPTFGRLDVPAEFYWVLRPPAPLAGMPFPFSFDWAAAKALGFDAVVCLTDDVPFYDPAPLSVFAVELTDLVGGRYPSDPDAELERIRTAVESVRGFRHSGTGVIVHCAGGTGRTGTVVGAVLVSEGLTVNETVGWLDALHRRRRKDGWPESPWQADILKEFSR